VRWVVASVYPLLVNAKSKPHNKRLFLPMSLSRQHSQQNGIRMLEHDPEKACSGYDPMGGRRC
jgi:hypothetical protein